MSDSDNVRDDIISFDELYEYETRNLAGCDNDDSCCTFPKGYVCRQALYHCLTCRALTGKQAAICYPCSLHCHSGHALEDLYTKRGFRCDCGNANFPDDFRCSLWEEKDDVNVHNKYNHNFSGLYCVCNLEYNERKEETEEMVQCIICEDWFHLKHLVEREDETETVKTFTDDDFDEFICKLCIGRSQYLSIYQRASINKLLVEYSDKNHEESPCYLEKITRSVNELDNCSSSFVAVFSCGAFMQSEWRRFLCRCKNCVTMMEENGTAFLLDSRDTITYYYDNDADNNRLDDAISEELSTLPYSQAIQFAEGVSTFKRHLCDFMNSFDREKVVTPDDVYKFFDKIKRRRLESPE